MKTYKELLEEGKSLLLSSKIEEAMLDAWLLLEYVAGISRAWYFAHWDAIVNEKTVHSYLLLIEKRAKHIPLQHLTHQAWFMGYEFYVDERVLIPRQDTETLAVEALLHLEEIEKPKFLDMCTGSGCLLLSILKENPDAEGTGVDISEDALKVALRNAEKLELEDRACLVQGDLFSADYFIKNSGRPYPEYDMLISNPPYIRTEEIPDLMEEVRLHDPMLALDGGEDGLIFYRRLATEAKPYLKNGAWVLFEIGCEQGCEVADILKQNDFQNISVKKDLAGLDRVVSGQLIL